MIDWNDYYYFALVADAGSYSKAALRAGVSKSVISRRIAALEQRLGVSLIQRTTRRLALTLAGEKFAAECQEMVLQSERARAVVQAEQVRPSGTLRVSAPVYVAETFLGEFVSRFLRRWPETNIQLTGVNRRVDMIAEGLDISLIAHAGELTDSSFHSRRLKSMQDILVASPEWLSENGWLQTLDDLSRADTLVRKGEGSRHVWSLVQGKDRIDIPVEPRLVSNNLLVLMQAVVAGNGVAMLPSDACEPYLSRGQLVQIFPECRSQVRHFSALFVARRGMTALARIFLDELGEELAKRGEG